VINEREYILSLMTLPETRFVAQGKFYEKDIQGRQKALNSIMKETEEWLIKKACILADVPRGLPCKGVITSTFGAGRGGGIHVGLDIGAPEGSPIFAPAEGVVITAGAAGGYGNVIILDHGGGFTTRYGHMSKLKVSKGDRVAAGDVIALVGHVGWATGNHLHYEVRLNGVPLDPAKYIPRALPVQLMDQSPAGFNEAEVGSNLGELEGGIKMETDEFVPMPLEEEPLDLSSKPVEKTDKNPPAADKTEKPTEAVKTPKAEPAKAPSPSPAEIPAEGK